MLEDDREMESLCVSLVRRQLEDIRETGTAYDIAFLEYILGGEHPRLLAQDYMAKILDMPDASKKELAQALGWVIDLSRCNRTCTT